MRHDILLAREAARELKRLKAHIRSTVRGAIEEHLRHEPTTARKSRIKGFRDEALSGEWAGYRSSRLGLQWRVIYRVVADEGVFQVASLTPHDYRRS